MTATGLSTISTQYTKPQSEAPITQFDPADIKKFEGGAASNREFWSRFKETPDLKDATVLDVGSGWGALCTEVALAGAKKVVGLDISSRLVEFANAYLKEQYPQLIGVVEFEALDLRDYDEVVFDYIVSKDAFEHIIELDRMLFEMRKRLKPGGRIYAGFGPLYTSPYGDHDRRRSHFARWGLWGRFLAYVPWGHLFTEPLIIAMNNRYQSQKVKSMHDLGLNKMSASDYRRVLRESGLTVVDWRINQSKRVWSKVFAWLARIPGLEDYVTHNVYCILEKPVIDSKST